MIQALHDCQHYRDNTNLNKTCTKGNKKCELYHSTYCPCFLKKEDKNATRE